MFNSPYLRVLTVGHSNHAMDHFVSLLKHHSVQAIADVRSHPYSAYASQFDFEPLKKGLQAAGFGYVYLGAQLGGRPKGNDYYDTDGRVLYAKVAGSTAFQEGLARLENGLRQSLVAVLCAEENPAACHRRLLVTRVLAERGVSIAHIRGDGRLETEDELSSPQLDLFHEVAAPVWKSIPSVSLKRRQTSSSAF